ncbi:MAG: hypothetical protein WCT77_12410 [Bacteroidota bacterium]
MNYMKDGEVHIIKGLSVVDLLFNCGERAKDVIGRGSEFVSRSTILDTVKLTGR